MHPLLIPIILPMFGAFIMTEKQIVEKDRLFKVCTFISALNAAFFLMSGIIGYDASFKLISLNSWIEIVFHIDAFGIIFGILSSFLWAMASLYAKAYMEDKSNTRTFFVFFLLTQMVVMGIALAGNLFTLYMFYELLTVVTFPLIIHTRTKEALRSGKKYIAYSFLGATLILMGMMILFSHSGSLEFVAGGVGSGIDAMPKNELSIAMVTLFFGFGVKAAIVPFHSWMPDAMVAPAPVSALLDALAIVKSGIFGIIRTVFFVIGVHNIKGLPVMNVFMIAVIISIVFGSFTGLHQKELKTRLAYSTISQLGYILFGIVFLNPVGLEGAMLHLVNHALIKILLFFCVGAILFMTGKKTIDEISGIGKQMPLTMLCFSIASVSLIGIPPTNGFVSKWYLGQSALAAGKTMNILILLFSAFLTSGYLLPIIINAFFTKSEEEKCRESLKCRLDGEVRYELQEKSGDCDCDMQIKKTDPPLFMLMPMFIIVGAIVILGILPNSLINYIDFGMKNLF